MSADPLSWGPETVAAARAYAKAHPEDAAHAADMAKLDAAQAATEQPAAAKPAAVKPAQPEPKKPPRLTEFDMKRDIVGPLMSAAGIIPGGAAAIRHGADAIQRYTRAGEAGRPGGLASDYLKEAEQSVPPMLQGAIGFGAGALVPWAPVNKIFGGMAGLTRLPSAVGRISGLARGATAGAATGLGSGVLDDAATAVVNKVAGHGEPISETASRSLDMAPKRLGLGGLLGGLGGMAHASTNRLRSVDPQVNGDAGLLRAAENAGVKTSVLAPNGLKNPPSIDKIYSEAGPNEAPADIATNRLVPHLARGARKAFDAELKPVTAAIEDFYKGTDTDELLSMAPVGKRALESIDADHYGAQEAAKAPGHSGLAASDSSFMHSILDRTTHASIVPIGDAEDAFSGAFSMPLERAIQIGVVHPKVPTIVGDIYAAAVSEPSILPAAEKAFVHPEPVPPGEGRGRSWDTPRGPRRINKDDIKPKMAPTPAPAGEKLVSGASTGAPPPPLGAPGRGLAVRGAVTENARTNADEHGPVAYAEFVDGPQGKAPAGSRTETDMGTTDAAPNLWSKDTVLSGAGHARRRKMPPPEPGKTNPMSTSPEGKTGVDARRTRPSDDAPTLPGVVGEDVAPGKAPQGYKRSQAQDASIVEDVTGAAASPKAGGKGYRQSRVQDAEFSVIDKVATVPEAPPPPAAPSDGPPSAASKAPPPIASSLPTVPPPSFVPKTFGELEHSGGFDPSQYKVLYTPKMASPRRVGHTLTSIDDAAVAANGTLDRKLAPLTEAVRAVRDSFPGPWGGLARQHGEILARQKDIAKHLGLEGAGGIDFKPEAPGTATALRGAAKNVGPHVGNKTELVKRLTASEPGSKQAIDDVIATQLLSGDMAPATNIPGGGEAKMALGLLRRGRYHMDPIMQRLADRLPRLTGNRVLDPLRLTMPSASSATGYAKQRADEVAATLRDLQSIPDMKKRQEALEEADRERQATAFE
jgi:hypothetical protein